MCGQMGRGLLLSFYVAHAATPPVVQAAKPPFVDFDKYLPCQAVMLGGGD